MIPGLLRSELTKILTTRLWWGLLVGALVLTAIQSGALASVAGLDSGAPTGLPGLDDPAVVRSVYASSAFSGAYILALVLGVTGMTGEYRYQTASPTFLATPRRGRVVAAKAAAHVIVGFGYGVAALTVAFAVGGAVILLRGYGLGLDTPGLWRAAALGALGVGIWTLVGLGIGTLVRNQVGAVLLAVVVTFLLEPLLGLALAALDLDAVGRFLPSAASSALTEEVSPMVELLPWWAGGLVLAAYGAAFAGVGALLTVRRDVT